MDHQTQVSLSILRKKKKNIKKITFSKEADRKKSEMESNIAHFQLPGLKACRELIKRHI